MAPPRLDDPPLVKPIHARDDALTRACETKLRLRTHDRARTLDNVELIMADAARMMVDDTSPDPLTAGHPRTARLAKPFRQADLSAMIANLAGPAPAG